MSCTSITMTTARQTSLSDGIFRRTYWLGRRNELILDKVEVLDAENAARVCRRTMKPWEILKHRDGRAFEAVSYPFVENGAARIMVRTEIGEPGSLVAIDCAELRPIQFTPAITGVPANDPLPRDVPRGTAR